MSLRALTILFIGLAFVSLTSVLLITQQVTLGRHFTEVEMQDAREDLRRAQMLLLPQPAVLESRCTEWSRLAAARLELGPAPAGLEGWYVLLSRRAPASAWVSSGKSGLHLVTSCPMDGGRQLVALSRLDAAVLQNTRSLLQAAVTVYDLQSPKLSETARSALQALQLGQGFDPQPINDLSVAAYALFTGPEGQPAALLEVLSPRRYLRSSMLTRNYLAVATVLSALIFAGTTLYVLEGLVLGRARRLSAEVSRIGDQSDLSARVSLSLNDELTALASNINRMLSSLEQSQQRRSELFSQVQAAQLSLQNLSRRLVSVQEEERRQIALELHDEIGQSLTGLKLLINGSHELPPAELHDRLQRCRELTNELIERVRQMSLELRPPMLDDLGLLPALLWQIDRYSEQTGIEVRFHHPDLMDRRFPPGVEIAAYRVVQEGLTNIARHAGVSSVDLHVWPSGDCLEIQLEDHGSGFDVQAALSSPHSSGLTGMRERVELLGGEFSLDTAPGQGCCVSVSFPLEEVK